MDMLNMKGRTIEERPKTLKPTLIQLVKSSQIFSVEFEPASLVSYIKEPELRWALNNVRGLSVASLELANYMEKMGYIIDDVDPDILLRICRTYGRENTKNIYVYSRVPGGIRQIKTYSAFLTFLSVNSFYNSEIQGLTIKLSDKEVGREYTAPSLIEEVYTVNNIISLIQTLISKSDKDFIFNMPLKPLIDINWPGGTVQDFIVKHFEVLYETDVRYSIIRAQHHCLMLQDKDLSRGAGFLDKCAYYTFLKAQKVRSGWYGKGEVYIHIDNNYYSFILLNNLVESLYTNRVGKLPLHHSEFIQDVLNDIGIDITCIKKPKIKDYNKQHFGIDMTGDYSIYKGRELSSGIPAIVLDKRNEFIDYLNYFDVLHINPDSIIISKGFESLVTHRKINLLPVKKVELIPLIQSIMVPEYFNEKLITTGLSNFEDFIYTEILTEYGKDVIIDFESFMDNYQSSKLYSIFKDVYDKGYSKINKSPSYSPLPASEGSLVRLLIDYSASSSEKIINTPVNLDSKIMQIRSEFSDVMATLLGENLSDYHKKIYTAAEVKEISEHYHNIYNNESIEGVRMSVIKLMTYWGYGSLVNCIQEFTLNRSSNNFKFFNQYNLGNVSNNIYSDLYPFIIKNINSCMIKWEAMFNNIEVPIKSLLKNTNFKRFIQDYCQEACIGTYDLIVTNNKHSIYNMQYMNILLGLLMEEDFVADLQGSLSSNYIFNSIPISWKLRFEFLATINVLKSLWQKSKKQDYELDYLKKVQRFNDTIHFKSLLKEFDIVTPPKDVHYNGFLTDELISFILSRGQIIVGDTEFRISVKIVKPSNIEVYMADFLKHPAPLNVETLEHDDFEDIIYEYTMSELDDETILDMFDQIDKPHYVPSTTKKLNIKNKKIITASVKWIVDPYKANSINRSKFYRQVGENIIVITDTYNPDFVKIFPNSGVRLINPTKILRTNSKTFFMFYSFHNLLYKQDFIKEYLGGQEFIFNENEENLLKAIITRNIDGSLVNPYDLGFVAQEKELSNDVVITERDGYLEYVKIEDLEKEENKEPMKTEFVPMGEEEDIRKLRRLQEINRVIDDLKNKKILDEESLNNLRNKYAKTALEERIPLSLLLMSTIQEADMMKIKMEILSNTSGISVSDQKKMFLAPENFGLGKSLNKNDVNPIKDKKVRAEINSFHPDLARLVGSNTLNLSHKMRKVVDANYKIWVRLNKSSKTKVENKNFNLTVFSSLCANTFLSDDEVDDHVWQELINKTTLYLSAEDDSDDEDDDEIGLMFNTVPASRLIYRTAGT